MTHHGHRPYPESAGTPLQPWPGPRTLARITTTAGAVLFLAAVIAHPRRDGGHIAAASSWYEITHSVEAVSLILQAVGLAAICALAAASRARDLAGPFTALLGTTWYFGLIVVDATRNPVTARYAPQVVHTSGDLDISTAVIVLPALLLFPVGHILLGVASGRRGARWPGFLLGAGATVYVLGGLAIFGLGATSPAVETLEIVGAFPYAVGLVVTCRFWSPGTTPAARLVDQARE